MPNNWKTYSLLDFLDINPKMSFNSNKEYSFVEMKDLDSNSRKVLPSDYKKLKGGAKFQNGDTLFARITPCLQNGKICQVQGLSKNKGFGSTEFLVFRGKENISDNDFVYYLSREPFVRQFAESNMIGTSGRQRVAKEAFQNLELELPPLQEQKAIAQILSVIDDKIENNLAINKTLEDMAMALYKHWFVDFGPFQDGEFIDSELGEIPKGWEVKRLDEVCNFSNGYAFKSKELLKTYNSDCYHVFKMGNIARGGGLKANGSKSFVKKDYCKNLQKYILKKGDLLMAMTDMKDKVAILGNTALIDVDDKYIVNQRVGLIRINNEIEIDFPFMFLATNEHKFLENLRNQANSGVQVNLSTNEIKSSKLIVGDIQTNRKFNRLVKENYETIFKNSQENETLTQLRDTFLPKLISGEVRLKEFKEEVKEYI